MARFVISASPFQSQVSDLLPCYNNGRSSLLYGMLKAYGLLGYFDEVIVSPNCSIADLRQFHSKEYLEVLFDSCSEEEPKIHAADNEAIRKVALPATNWLELNAGLVEGKSPWSDPGSSLYKNYLDYNFDGSESVQSNSTLQHRLHGDESLCLKKSQNLMRYGLSHDCHIFEYLPMYCKVLAGATLALAKHAVHRGQRTISINWDGGRHHALRSKASGFCYINDIALLVLRLRKLGIKALSYVDFDLHHGDGVERAFQYSANVQTISVHLLEPGFFPGSGTLKDARQGKNVVNLPVLHGLDDNALNMLVNRAIVPAMKRHKPQAIIIQCGADGLMGDKYGEWQLTIAGLAENILTVMRSFPDANIVLLGGGGYNEKLTSRFYTFLTWKVLSEFSETYEGSNPFEKEEDVIPDHEFLDSYKDEFYKFWYYDSKGCRTSFLKNDNTRANLEKLVQFYSTA
ncbi:LAFA_0G09934g1_1 [Lachancea sp. 'fantastica']|nr:LAFA_0G09934g1_1 [Lachancea sp. 'fantastica']